MSHGFCLGGATYFDVNIATRVNGRPLPLSWHSVRITGVVVSLQTGFVVLLKAVPRPALVGVNGKRMRNKSIPFATGSLKKPWMPFKTSFGGLCPPGPYYSKGKRGN